MPHLSNLDFPLCIENPSLQNLRSQQVVSLVPLERNGSLAYSLWVIYYWTNETTIANAYPYWATVAVTVQATDPKGFSLEPAFFRFRMESAEAARWAEENAPATVVSNGTGPVRIKNTLLKG
jgi:hypothetical protein